MDYYQKPALFAIFLSFIPQTLKMCGEISKIKLTVGQTHKQYAKYIKMVNLLNSAP